MDVDYPAAPGGAGDTMISREGPRREGQIRIERPDQLELTEREDANTPNTVPKTNGVIPCGLYVMHAIFSDTCALLLGISLSHH